MGAKRGVADIAPRRASCRSLGVILYGSLGGGRKVMGK